MLFRFLNVCRSNGVALRMVVLGVFGALLVAAPGAHAQNNPASPGAARTLPPLAAEIRARYGENTTFTAHFNQHVSSAFLDSDERYSGQLLLSGNAYRVETGGQTIVSDGTNLWIHNIAERQVLLSNAEDESDDFSLTSFLGEFDTAYQSTERPDTTIQGQRLRTLSLTPTDPFASFQTVTMWVRPQDAAIVRLSVVDQTDVVMLFLLTDIAFPATLPDSTFHFEVPTGAELVDLR